MAQCVRSTLNRARTPQSVTKTVSAKSQAFASVSFLRTSPELKKYPKPSSLVMSCQGKSLNQQEQRPPQLSLDDLVMSNRKEEVLGTIKDSLSNCLSDTNLLETVPSLKSRIKGKVRNVYDAGDYLVLITTDRLSAFDRNSIPFKGQIVEGGFMTQAEFDEASMKALSLFEFGQRVAKEHGLILVDTKYEFGRSSDGSISLIDEIHTPDSSRYWLAGSYEERFQKDLEPENVDKEFLRQWFKEICNPYEDEICLHLQNVNSSII